MTDAWAAHSPSRGYYAGIILAVYEWWPGAKALIREAGVETWEVIEVLYSARRWLRPARSDRGLDVLTVWGRTDEGRPVIVALRRVTREDGTTGWQIVLAAPMGPRQLEEFTAWEAQQ